MLLASTLALLMAACGAYGGGAPADGAGPATGAPKASAAPTLKGAPLPSGNPDADNYGY